MDNQLYNQPVFQQRQKLGAPVDSTGWWLQVQRSLSW